MVFLKNNKIAYFIILIALLGFSFNAIAEETVKVILTEYPSIVYHGQPYSISWEISGGIIINNTKVHWKSGDEKDFKISKFFSGGTGKYTDDTLFAPVSNRKLDHIIFMIYAKVDGEEVFSAPHVITLQPKPANWIEQKEGEAVEIISEYNPWGAGWHEAQFITWDNGGTISKVYTEHVGHYWGSYVGQSYDDTEILDPYAITENWNYYIISPDTRPTFAVSKIEDGIKRRTNNQTGETTTTPIHNEWYGTEYNRMELRSVDFHEWTYTSGGRIGRYQEETRRYDYTGSTDVNLIYYVPSLKPGMEIESVILAFSSWWGSGASVNWVSVAGKTGKVTKDYFNKTLWVFDLTDTGKIVPGSNTVPLKAKITGHDWLDDTGEREDPEWGIQKWDRHGYDLQFLSNLPIKLYVKVREEKDKGKGKDPDTGQADDVNITNGNMYSIIKDLSIPAKGLPIEFTRTYNSKTGYNGPLGYGWTHNYNVLLTENPDGSITERDEDGTLIDFVYEDAWKGGILDKVDISTGEVKLAKTLEGTDLPQSSNIQGFWKFEEASGIIHDETANHNDGAYNGTLYRQAGKVGYALGFDGVDDYVEVPNNSSLDATTATWAFWIKLTGDPGGSGTSSAGSIIGRHDAYGSFNGVHVYCLPNEGDTAQVKLQIKDSTSIVSTFVSGYHPTLNFGEWYHIAVVFKSGEYARIYKDGLEAAIYTLGTFPFNNQVLRIGMSLDSYWKQFNGTIDEVAIWNKALTASEISSLQNPSVYELKYASSRTLKIKFDADSTQSWQSYAFVGDETNGTNIKIRFRSSDTETGLEGATWSQYYDIVRDMITDVPDGQWIETEVTLESDTTQTYTPTLKRFIINYSGGSKTWESGYKAWDHSVIIKNPDGTFTLTRKHGVKYNFNSSGRFINITDRNNNQITLTYTDGLLTAITDASGRVVNLSYTGDRITQITDPANRLINYNYDGNNNLIQVRDPSNNITACMYDANHNLVTISYANGNHRYFVYDEEDRCIETKRDGDNQKFTFSYDPVNSTTIMTDANGNQKVFIYNKEKGVVTSITDGLGNVTSSTWDEDINRTSIIQP